MGAIGFLIGILVVGALVWLLLKHRGSAKVKSAVRGHGASVGDSHEQEYIAQARQAAIQFPDGHWETSYNTSPHPISGTVNHIKMRLWPGDRIEMDHCERGERIFTSTDYPDGRVNRTWPSGETRDWPNGTGGANAYLEGLKYFPDGAA